MTAPAVAAVGSPPADPTTPPDPPPAVLAIELAALALVALTVGSGFGRVFFGAPLWRTSALAVLGALVVGELVGRFGGRRAGTTLLASAAVAALAAPVVVWSAAPTPSAVADALVSLADAPRRILSVPLPVDPSPPLLVVAFATTWAVAAVGFELARRTRHPFLPLAPAAVAVLVPVVLAAGGPVPTDGQVTLGLLAAGAVAVVRAVARPEVVIHSSRSAAEARRRRLGAGAAVAVAVALLAPPLGRAAPGVGGGDRLELRGTPVAEPTRVDSPLARVAAVRRDPQRLTAFEATAADGPVDVVDRWRVAVLDRYDGSSWSADGALVRVAERLPGPAPAGRTVRYEVQVTDTGTVFLPLPGVPISVAGADVRYDRRTGNVAAAGGRADGLRYVVTAAVPSVGDQQLRGATRAAAASDAPADTRSLPTATDLQVRAQAIVRQAPPDPTRTPDANALEALRVHLSDPDRFAIDPERSGESVRQLEQLVLGDAEASGDRRTGSAEQFVAAYAVLARSLGFATRVVVGYRPVADGAAVTATNRDIASWVEVDVEGAGWVAIDVGPTDEDRTETTQPPPPATTPSDGGSAPDVEEADAPPVDDDPEGAGRRGVTGPLVAVAAVLVALVLGAGLRRPVRRWARGRGDARSRVLGAWAEAVDVVGRAGVPVGSSRTRGQVGLDAAEVLDGSGRAALERLRGTADRAAWAAAPVDAAVADEAWALVGQVRAGLLPRRDRRPGERSPLRPRSGLRTVGAPGAPGGD